MPAMIRRQTLLALPHRQGLQMAEHRYRPRLPRPCWVRIDGSVTGAPFLHVPCRWRRICLQYDADYRGDGRVTDRRDKAIGRRRPAGC